jgi:hypothetical protein
MTMVPNESIWNPYPRTTVPTTGTTKFPSMWRRFRRKTMTPGRPALYPEQLGLLLLSIAAVGGGVYVVIRLLGG